MRVDVTQRQERARALFKEGYNCAQSVALTYSDIMAIDPENIATLSAPFGGGFGRLGEVCGTLSGMSMVYGAIHPASDPSKRESKAKIYALTRSSCEEFRSKNGSILCRELLKIRQYSCAELVEQVVAMIADSINSQE